MTDYTQLLDVIERYESIVGAYADRITMMLDLKHADDQFNIDWPAMVAGRAFDLVHDVAGIARHIDRRTGIVGDCFVPRYHRAELGL